MIQEREFEPLGGTKTVRVDVCVIAATYRNLQEEVQKGNFRDDLYYRLNVIRIKIALLAERREDLPLLTHYFIDHFNRLQGKAIRQISTRALQALMTAPLSDNVRELENAIEYAFVICREDTIRLQHLPPQHSADGRAGDSAPRELGISRQTLWRKMARLGIEA